MPQNGLIFRILVASPSDCAQERKIITEVVMDWNAANSWSFSAVLDPVLWETHSRPEMGDRPQEILNKQIVDRCDLLVGAFWTRLGTSTGNSESGTAEEIERFRKAGKLVLLYFSNMPVVPESLDLEQYKSLIEYKEQLKKGSLLSEFDSQSKFRHDFTKHLSGHMNELLKGRTLGVDQVAAGAKETENQIKHRERFKNNFEIFQRRISAEWKSERDSNPGFIDGGILIINKVISDIVGFRSMVLEGNVDLASALDLILLDCKKLQRHRILLDGGKSFRDFWDKGDAIIASLINVQNRI